MADPRSADELVKRFTDNQQLIEQLKTDPAATLQKVANQVVRDFPPPALQSDPVIYRIVVTVLGLAVLAALSGAIVLSLQKLAIPETLTALGSAAVGALAGLLAPSPTQRSSR